MENATVTDTDAEEADDGRDPDFLAERPARTVVRGRARGRGRARRVGQPRPVRGRGGRRGRAGGRNPPAAAAPAAPAPAPAAKSYDDPDTPNQLPPFNPRRQPGLHLNIPRVRGAMTRAVDFFRLFFTVELIREICTHTNSYAWGAVLDKSYYGDRHGAWVETTPEEIEKMIALIL